MNEADANTMMTTPLKHSVIAAICLVGAAILFAIAVLWGSALIESAGAPTRALLSHLAEQVGKAGGQDILKPDAAVYTRIAFIVAVIAVAAGVGLARGFDELCKALHCRRGNQYNRV